MRTLPRAILAAGLAAAIAATGASAIAAPPKQRAVKPAATRDIACTSDSSGQPAAFYDGDSASYVYDGIFGHGPALPELATHTPQGVAVWFNYKPGQDLLVVSAYRDGANAYLIGIDAKTGAHVGTVAIAPTHAGGIAITKGWAFVQGPAAGGKATIRRYRLADLKRKLLKPGAPRNLKPVGKDRKVFASAFLSSYGDTLYAGSFNQKGRGKMFSYTVADNGSLTKQAGGGYEVPKKTQGLLVTSTHFIYSTSYGNDNRSNLYVTPAGTRDIDIPATKCFRAPSMTEGITEYAGNAYLVYESGAAQYVAKNPRNEIHEMHVGSVAKIIGF